MNEAIARLVKPLGENRDLLLVLAIIGILIAILVPLPAPVMDAFLTLNIVFSLLILLTTIYVKSPLDFSVFPSLLLVATLYRLALNIATTRLILSNILRGSASRCWIFRRRSLTFGSPSIRLSSSRTSCFVIFRSWECCQRWKAKSRIARIRRAAAARTPIAKRR